MQSKAQNKGGSSPASHSLGSMPGMRTPSSGQSSQGHVQDDPDARSGFQTRFFMQDGHASRNDAPITSMRPDAANPPPPSGIPYEYASQSGFPLPDALYGTPDRAAYPGSPGASPELREEDSSVSPLHLALIAMILLGGLAIGIGRSWWIDEQLEASSAKKSAVAGLSTRPSVEEDPPPSSLQSSIDRAYIPSLSHPEKETPTQDQAASLAIDPGPVSEAPEPPAPVAQAQAKPDPVAKHEELDASTNPVQTNDDARAAKQPPAATQTADDGREKKRKPRRDASSQKLASSSKKERMREIDRVRTQAFSETSRDRIGERKPRPAESSVAPQSERRNAYRASKVAQRTVTSAQYARCERIDHIIRREKCKWDLCNNKWGKGACPSFKNEKPFLF